MLFSEGLLTVVMVGGVGGEPVLLELTTADSVPGEDTDPLWLEDKLGVRIAVPESVADMLTLGVVESEGFTDGEVDMVANTVALALENCMV